MVTKTLFLATTLGLLLATSAARADHGKGVKYAVGGALLGIALAELAHDRHHGYERYYYYDDHGHRYREPRRKHRHRARHDAHYHGDRHYRTGRYVVRYDNGRRGRH